MKIGGIFMGYVKRPKDIFDRIKSIPTLIALDYEFSKQNMEDFERYAIDSARRNDIERTIFLIQIADKSKETLKFYNKIGIHN